MCRIKITFAHVLFCALLQLYPFSDSYASNWKDVYLEGTFTGYTTAKGVGNVSYSFGLEKVVRQGGDIHFCVDYSDVDEVAFYFIGFKRIGDLGTFKSGPPEIPKRLRTTYKMDRLVLGHFYYMEVEGGRVLLQPTNFNVISREDTGKSNWFYKEEVGEAELQFRYLFTSGDKADLNTLLKPPQKTQRKRDIPKQSTENKTAPKVPNDDSSPAKKRVSAFKNEDLILDREVLLSEFDGFQASASAFLDRETGVASVEECEDLVEKSQLLSSSMSRVLEGIDTESTSISDKIESTKGQLKSTSNLQIADRMRTQIDNWEKTLDENTEGSQRWRARQSEIRKITTSLQEFLAFLKIIESK